MYNSILEISDTGKSCLGTGFVIDNDENGVFVATCGHVINNCKNSILVEGNEAEIIINEYNQGLDLAILYVKNLHKKPLSMAIQASSNSVKVIGYSKLRNDPKKESINDINIKFDIEITKSPSLKINALKLYPKEAISNGYSGSPVICQTSNKVIGIVNIQVGEDTNYAISTKHLFDIYTISNEESVPVTPKIITKKKLTTNLAPNEHAIIKNKFELNLATALKSFSTLQNVWIEPRLHTKAEDSNNLSSHDTKINIHEIIDGPKSLVIQARQQFGLSCLAHYLVQEAWNNTESSFWLYLDANELKPHLNEIDKTVKNKLKDIRLIKEDIECVILDEFSSNVEDAEEILKKLSIFFNDTPIIVMLTLVDNPLLNESINSPTDREFGILHLWALQRHDVRIVVSKYNEGRYIEDENRVLDKVISDLEVLNIPRTPLNCLTILKISEVEFDDSPVNRTDMIKRVLFLLFNVDDIPKYKTKPDLKDTEFILGYFCELLLVNKNYYFSREKFLQILEDFCLINEIDLELHVIFDVLYKNNIIVMRGSQFCFKFTYWILYFAAHRMYHNPDFANFIFERMQYTAYPELIEFYTGIDRRRDDALNILINDIKTTCNIVDEKCGLPADFNIYNIAQWIPSTDRIEQMQNEISDGVQHSNLPDEVKDQYVDQTYSRSRPLHQSIHSILEEYSLLRLMKSVQAGARALRNSDYSHPSIRHNLLKEIMRSWEQIIKVLIVISPILSEKGHATLDGASFVLNGEFGASPEERFNQIIQILPSNIVFWYRDDLFSRKMGTLLYNHIQNESNQLIKHTLNLLIINKRPKGWDKHIEDYIVSESKNSFYLLDIYQTLRAEYQYAFVSNSTLKTIEKLIKMSAAKHIEGMDKPSKKMIKQMDDRKKYADVIPNRDVDY